MADFLKFINELTVNGKPVEEDNDDDKLEDDYTKTDDDYIGDDDKLDLALGDDEPVADDNDDNPVDDDDYTATQDDDVDDNPDPATEEPTADDGGTEEPATSDDDGDELDLNLDDTDNDPTDTDEQPEDNTEPASEEPTDDNPDPAAEEPTDDATGQDDVGGDDGELDMDTGGDDSGDDDYTDDGTGGETGEEDPDMGDTSTNDTSDSQDSELEARIKQTEAEIFNTLSDEEKAIKNKDLVDNFITLKTIIKTFLEKVRTITTTDENDAILQFVEMSLLDLGNMTTDYIITRYSKKSYIENFVTYQQIILTIEQLREIISKLKVDENPKK